MIKVGYLISYDFDLIFKSLPTIYDQVDTIYFAVDKNCQTWSGNTFEIPESFFDKISAFDIDQKIVVYKDNFYIPELSPMENEVRERNLLLNKMGKGWLIQLDVDEYFCNFSAFANQLKKKQYLLHFNWLFPVTLSGNWVTLFRKVDEGYLVVANKNPFNFLTNIPRYTAARKNKWQYCYNTRINCFHQSWARDEQEIKNKIDNWGHKNDFDTKRFFEFWKNVDTSNYKNVENFHPLETSLWQSLVLIECNDIHDLEISEEHFIEPDFSNLTAFNIIKNNWKIRMIFLGKYVSKIGKKIRNKIS